MPPAPDSFHRFRDTLGGGVSWQRLAAVDAGAWRRPPRRSGKGRARLRLSRPPRKRWLGPSRALPNPDFPDRLSTYISILLKTASSPAPGGRRIVRVTDAPPSFRRTG